LLIERYKAGINGVDLINVNYSINLMDGGQNNPVITFYNLLI